MMAITSEGKLRQIYRRIPDFNCAPKCNQCCGPVPWAIVEHRVITKWMTERGVEERFTETMFDSCPYIKDNKCSIYEIRPILCRIFGVVDTPKLMCPYRSAKDRLTDEEARKMIDEVFALL